MRCALLHAIIPFVSALILGAGPANADINVSKKPTLNMSCSGSVCTATAKNAVLNVGDLETMLASGDTTVKYGGGALAIQINDGFSWTSTSRLTLDANTSIGVHRPVVVAGKGALTLTYNDGGTDGDLKFFDTGKVDFWDTSSSLIINGNSYTLAKDIKSLAGEISAKPSGYYALARDYSAARDGSYKQAPIATAFRGVFEGLSHRIAHLSISGKKRPVGLFASTESRATIRDINLADVIVSGTGRYVGALAGENDGVIAHVSVNGRVSGVLRKRQHYGGGIVGFTPGPIEDSEVHAAVYGYYAGGIAGFGDDITRCRANGLVMGYTVGGIAGEGVSVSQSWAHVSVEGEAASWSGGLVGESGKISDSYATGQVSGGDYASVGGLVGSQNLTGPITTSYAIGSVNGRVESYLGGVVGTGRSDGVGEFDYWNIHTSGVSKGCGRENCTGVTPLTTKQFKSGLPKGFDPNIWAQAPNINNGYPYLRANPPPH